MRRPWWLARREREDEDRVLGTPGPVLSGGVPVVGPDGEPLQKVLVASRRDASGYPVEEVWVDPRIAWQYDESRWS